MSEEERTAVETAIVNFGANGWEHHSLAWKHIGFYEEKDGYNIIVRAALLDLGSVHPLESEEIPPATDRMLRQMNLP